ncbi:hypothetical protein FHW18_004549 [Pigmentiphaga litoralis]|uniref:Phage integrase family protein n=1 Tax=Pigmentiphaga litoralis TaxID=516702 RepID=A0A7Y9IY49_9BURK|nr:hypothetical protein [Pigmentiphaga litoralis]NYE85242.1 hypothetical protein [Pigmentiphaga litoralis]
MEAGLSYQEVPAISGHKSMQMLKRYKRLQAEDFMQKLESQLPDTKLLTPARKPMSKNGSGTLARQEALCTSNYTFVEGGSSLNSVT